MDRFIAVTGGPGSGKSTLIDALAARGFARSTEAGRAIIQDQVASGGDALPWGDREAFAALMLEHELRAYRSAEAHDGPVLFDRGLPDIVGYRRLCGLQVPDDLAQAARHLRYNARVFVAPPWPAIFVQDAERKQTLDEAEATFHALSAAYIECGYALIALPLATVEARVAFVIARLGMEGNARCM